MHVSTKIVDLSSIEFCNGGIDLFSLYIIWYVKEQ